MTMRQTTNTTNAGPTPGPWKVDARRFGPHLTSELRIHAGPATVAVVTSDNVEDVEANETATADARLIAAAPDLLDALYRVLDFGGDVNPTVRAYVRDVIARAEGKGGAR